MFLLVGVWGFTPGVYSLLVSHDSDANFVPLNTADDWLHLVLGVGMIGLGVFLPRAEAEAR